MKLFTCPACGNLIYFENVACTRCGATLGFAPSEMVMAAFTPDGDRLWRRVGDTHEQYKKCSNYAVHAACNWMLNANEPVELCAACQLNRTIPDLSIAENLPLWRTLETEKRRLAFTIMRLGLPLTPRSQDDAGLAFDFLADPDPSFNERGRVMTGHAQGVITLNIAEADPALRVSMREQMGEPYRTILGHFRHESGHYYWDRLIRDSHRLTEFRRQFGDETQNYSEALERHYQSAPPQDWSQRFVSAYASSHPWEDWAETWAHYLHMIDTLETAYQFGLMIHPRAGDDANLDVRHDFDPYNQQAFSVLVDHWLPLTFALNSLNRSMGHAHAYPFVLGPQVLQKLEFVHLTVREASSVNASGIS
ncbi:putative zinc-binding peptidase [Hahella sp. CR1]|uniref:zinc-binding metallopeptidase family protein n=1 Tax=Hahella sp. CR1 TaxID=2992807 RepID=UPI002442FD88|nr:putative zinc-binding peptidase [Hahella sp. CR1]MDG9670575.1 putative zinc-binding peptidase [Hahella sp. CR1]